MDSKQKFSRRQMLALAGLGILSPVIGKAEIANKADGADADYDTLLKADGTVVKVPKSVVKESVVVKEQVSNRSLFSWLKKDNK